MYGLKIRQLVSPVFPHRFPPFNRWVEQEAAARFPNDNENWTARLGIVGTRRISRLAGAPLHARRAAAAACRCSQGASRLTLAALLLGTVGGFGVVFNLFVSSDIRAYNRISPFIAFFSLLAVVDRRSTASSSRRAPAPQRWPSFSSSAWPTRDRRHGGSTNGMPPSPRKWRVCARSSARWNARCRRSDGVSAARPRLHERERLRTHEAVRPLQAVPGLEGASLQLSGVFERTGALAAGDDTPGSAERSRRGSPRRAFRRFWSTATAMRTRERRSSPVSGAASETIA